MLDYIFTMQRSSSYEIDCHVVVLVAIQHHGEYYLKEHSEDPMHTETSKIFHTLEMLCLCQR